MQNALNLILIGVITNVYLLLIYRIIIYKRLVVYFLRGLVRKPHKIIPSIVEILLVTKQFTQTTDFSVILHVSEL